MARLFTLVMDNRDLLEFAYAPTFDFLNDITLDHGYNLRTNNNFDGYMNTPLQTETELYAGGFMNPVNSTNNSSVITFQSDDTVIGGLRYQNSSNRLELVIGTTAVATTTMAIAPTTTYHIQVRYKLHSSAGVIELKVNNDAETLTYNGNTTNGQSKINRVKLEAADSGFRWDSFWLNNTSGSTNIGYMGILRMKILHFLANSAVADHNQFTKSTGSDAAAILDKQPYTTNNDYIWTSTDNQKQFMTVEGHGLVSPAIIHSYDSRYVSMLISGGRLEPNIRPSTGSSDHAGTIFTPGVVPSYNTYRWETDPNTGLAFDLGTTIEMGLRSVIP